VITCSNNNARSGNCTAEVDTRCSRLTADEKWNSPQPGSHILYANPAECQTFLGSGELTVTEFIRTHNSLASKGYVNWTDPQFHGTLTRTVGQRFFHHMANLNLGYLNDLVTASRKEKIQYLDYSTECKLRRLLDKEERDSWAREQLRRHREFYKKWEKELFSDHVFEVPTLTPAIGQSLEATTTMSLQSSGWLLRWNLYAVVSGIISCIIFIH